MQPSREYMALATTLLDALGDKKDASDIVLLQLQALFGPMLTSALQLVDKRDVVRVSLPHGRYVYQITASTGKPYTLHLDLPEPPATEVSPKAPIQTPDGPPDSPTINSTNVVDGIAVDCGTSEEAKIVERLTAGQIKKSRMDIERKTFEGMYCPCPGFAYNSLAGEKNVLCKHLLAALIGWKTGREIKTEVALHGVVPLLGLQDGMSDKGAYTTVQVKTEEAG